MDDRIERLIADAAACEKCGEEHHYRRTSDPKCEVESHQRWGWGHPGDGHAYRRKAITTEWLRAWREANPS